MGCWRTPQRSLHVLSILYDQSNICARKGMALPSFGRRAYALLFLHIVRAVVLSALMVAAGSCGCEAELLRMLKAYERRVAYGNVVYSCLMRCPASQLLLRLIQQYGSCRYFGFRWFDI